MMDDVTTLLRRLPEPDAPPSFAAHVMARVAREPESAAAEARAPHDRTFAAWILAGTVVAAASLIYGWSSTGTLPDVTSPRIGPGSPRAWPLDLAVMVFLLVGLLLYLVGLFAPLRDRR